MLSGLYREHVAKYKVWINGDLNALCMKKGNNCQLLLTIYGSLIITHFGYNYISHDSVNQDNV